jgi:phosphatidylglycerol---prolipoprotein diacylglyceryl transferase
MADALAPGLLVAQAVGRLGNWFNQELYGRPTHLPWAVRIDSNHQIGVIAQNYQQLPYGYYQPTFLYESIWDLGTALALILLDRKYKLGHGRVFALYLVIYGLGRSWIEALRIDPAHKFYGLRLNDWTSIVIVVIGILGFLISAKLRPGRETSLLRKPPPPDVDSDASIATSTDATTEPIALDAELADVRPPVGDAESNAP